MFLPYRPLGIIFLVGAASTCSPDSTTPSIGSLESPGAGGVSPSAALVVGRPHEPTGFAAVMINPASNLPTSTGFSTSVDGLWHLDLSPPVSEVNDATAPCSPPGVWSAVYYMGLMAGRGPAMMDGKGGIALPESRRWYIRACIKVGRTGQYENQAATTKLFFVHIGDDPGPARCSLIPTIKGDAKQAVKSTWNAGGIFECAGVLPTATFYQLANVGRPIKADVWQVHEWLIDAGDVNQANGRFQWWIDGQLVMDHQNHKFRTTADENTHGIYRWRWAPTWGGMIGVRTRTDYYKIDDVYISGWGKP